MAKTKLNKNAQKWVRALRSGKYKQGKNFLATYPVIQTGTEGHDGKDGGYALKHAWI